MELLKASPPMMILTLFCLLLVSSSLSIQQTDDLQPYEDGKEAPQWHEAVSRRHAEEVAPYSVTQGSTGPAKLEVRRFIENSIYGAVEGYMSFVSSPAEMLAFYPPKQGCVGVRTQTSETATYHKCFVASNAGYFNASHTGDCIGNLVSDGDEVLWQNKVNAGFGVTTNNTLITGYFNKMKGHEAPVGTAVESWDGKYLGDVVQSITGVIWLVKDGKVFVDESQEWEDLSIQQTGSKFCTIQSARAALGHDKDGNVVLAQIDGESYKRGVNLYEFAKILVSRGVVSAINLDGGGSATTVKNGEVVNFVSDKCDDDHFFRCERPVTSIVCIRDPPCTPECVNGACINGICKCNDGFHGNECAKRSDPCIAASCPRNATCHVSNGMAVCSCPVSGDPFSKEGCTDKTEIKLEQTKQSLVTSIVVYVIPASVFTALSMMGWKWFSQKRQANQFYRYQQVAGNSIQYLQEDSTDEEEQVSV